MESVQLGFAKVNVDGVYADFEVVQLEKPPNDEVVTLGQTKITIHALSRRIWA